MKQTILLLAIAFMCAFSTKMSAQKFSDIDKSVHDIAYYKTDRSAPPTVKVLYGRPLKRGREIFGSLVPFNKVWRTGANEATEIKFYKDVMFGDEKVKEGTYSLFTIPGAGEWTIILSKDTDVWGAYSYKKENDVARITVPVTMAGESLEAFSIAFKPATDGAYMVLGWDKTRVEVPIK
ncbi:DUF2911 domain-containing protein [Abyssalbus ytuae]|uniref:DUF2911 domain-containing protein n=1 Tax=Abyssalbus ytuae TaxID=2926907 RepID=A0A9E6ZRG5_9FLAO|nr:DUF2911 domain-containing protein [Abyssalbus ytuae]UOB16528.1 DUF2911 domain-containing protein [Abyssalbus ytuae]